MKGKKFAVVLLMLSLLLGTFGIANISIPAKAELANSIWVEPKLVNATELGLHVGDQFTVEVWINVTADLYGFEYKLQWDDSLIHYVSHTHYEPWSPNFVAKDEATPGQYWYGASALAPAEPFSGVMKVLDITFEVAYEPYYPEPDMSCALDLVDTKMGDPDANPIPHTAYDGQYWIASIPPPKPSLRVTPALVDARGVYDVGDKFNVSIEILSLAAAWDLAGFEFKLSYDNTLLSVSNVYEGPFLPSFAGANGTFFTYRDRPADGYVVAAGLFLGNHTKPYGSGVLAEVEFTILTKTTYPEMAECDLILYDVKLVSSDLLPIDYEITQQGHYIAPWVIVGPALDVYTEDYRWPGYTTRNIGEGPNAAADAFAPQEEVTLFAKLTYLRAPVQLKEVAWEIHAPNGEIYYRQSETDMKGIANITIRMPWWEEYFGEWWVLAKASIAEEPVNDTLTFQLGYIISVNSSKTLSPVNRGEEVTVQIFLKNIGDISRNVYITVTVYDDVGMPVASGGRNETVAPGVTGPYTFQLLIAEWAHVGVGTVYINLFTDVPPSECGTCYAPEHVQTFQITFTDP